ncbi:HepT-like ribonuclease domain-containing protein [Deinococcus saxicola]
MLVRARYPEPVNAPSPHLFPDTSLQEVARIIRSVEPQWRRMGASRVRIFGSVARGEANDLSDVDLLVDFVGEAGLLDLMNVKDLFEDTLRRRIDVLTEGGLKPQLRREILSDAVDVQKVPLYPQTTFRRKRWMWRVHDLLDALDRVRDYTEGHTLDSFIADELTRDAVLRNLARLGETTKFIPQSVEDRHPQVPWAYLRDIRNLVAHDYFGIDPVLVWHTAISELVNIRPALQELASGGEE